LFALSGRVPDPDPSDSFALGLEATSFALGLEETATTAAAVAGVATAGGEATTGEMTLADSWLDMVRCNEVVGTAVSCFWQLILKC